MVMVILIGNGCFDGHVDEDDGDVSLMHVLWFVDNYRFRSVSD